MTVNLPETIELSTVHLVWVWGIIHVLYALITHYHCVLQFRRDFSENVNSNGYAHPKLCSRCIFSQLGWLLFCGIEWKAIQMFAFVVLWFMKTIFTLDATKPFRITWHRSHELMLNRRCKHASQKRFGDPLY